MAGESAPGDALVAAACRGAKCRKALCIWVRDARTAADAAHMKRKVEAAATDTREVRPAKSYAHVAAAAAATPAASTTTPAPPVPTATAPPAPHLTASAAAAAVAVAARPLARRPASVPAVAPSAAAAGTASSGAELANIAIANGATLPRAVGAAPRTGGDMAVDAGPAVELPAVMGWTAPRGSGLPLEVPGPREAAVALANAITLVAPGNPIPIPALALRLGDAWNAGAEAIVDYLSTHGLARQDGEGDAETVTFHARPEEAHV